VSKGKIKTGKTTKKIMIHHEAQIFADMLARWGMVAGAPHGEDSAGRAKGRLLDPDELVARACAITEMYMLTAKVRGWIEDAPANSEK